MVFPTLKTRLAVVLCLVAAGSLIAPRAVAQQASEVVPLDTEQQDTEQQDTEQQDTEQQVDEQKIDDMIARLGSPKFGDRKAAQRDLQRMGVAAIKALERAVLNDESDVADRALEILKQHFRGESLSLNKAAMESLRRIAATEGHRKQAAAQNVLTPMKLKPDSRTPNFAPRINMPQFKIPQIQINGGGNRISVKSSNINGRRDLQIDENGKKWRFSDQAGGGIKVQSPDGKGGVKTKVYPDKKAFEKADPDTHKVYKRYSSNGGNRIRVQIGGGGLFGPQMPFGPRPEFRPRQLRPDDRQLKPVEPAQPRQQKPELPKSDKNLIEV